MSLVKLEHVNKYFNRKKKNEIHVIDDTTLEFPDHGLVGLVGLSGCGKTTLLNAIGGLDRVQSGQIWVNNEKITSRRSGKVDEIRNLNIGYIFQNYHLAEEMTVFENVAMVLNMLGVTSRSEIQTKVQYALEMVGMYRYRKRFVNMLSGGERQRVGIARAIVKNPPVILADEPTGNLDAGNTLEVMNIIKAISRTHLVILVTHEEKLVEFYANRVIRIRDGRIISDESNQNADRLDYRVDRNIYLRDMTHQDRLENERYDIRLYSSAAEKVRLTIAVKDKNLYIQSPGEQERVEVVDDSSQVKLIDGHYHTMTQEDFLRYRFDAKKLAYRSMPRYASILTFKEMICSGFRKVASYQPLKKVLLLGFFLSAMFIVYSISNLAGVLHISENQFITVNRDYLKLQKKHITVAEYLSYEKLPSVEYLIPGDSKVGFSVPYQDYLQTSGRSGALSGSLTSIRQVTKKDLIWGRMPSAKQEIVVDQLAIRRMQQDGTARMAGLDEVRDFLGKTARISGMDDFTIVGITDQQEPCIYTDLSLFIEIVSGSLSGEEAEQLNEEGTAEEQDEKEESEEAAEDETLVDYHHYRFSGGTKPIHDNEVVVSEQLRDSMPVGKRISRKVNGHRLKVVGYYRDSDDSSFFLVNTKTLRNSVIEKNSTVTVCTRQPGQAEQEFRRMGISVKQVYRQERNKYVKEHTKMMQSGMILALVILAISFLEIFLMMRSSFLSRVKEVGVYRAIGVKKKDICRMFLGEILAITILAGIPGYAFMMYIVHRLTGIEALQGSFLLNPGIGVCSLVFIFLLNVVFGLLPVLRTLRKTPAEILSRTDVD